MNCLKKIRGDILGNSLEMKSLEKVIKLKSRLIDVKKPETNSISEIFTQYHNGEKLIYLVRDLNDKNIIELVQQITPLIYYLISKNRNEEEKSLIISLEFPPSEALLNFPKEFKINDENPLKNSIKEFIKDFKTEGYFITFTKNFNLHIILKTEESETERPDTTESAEEWIRNFMMPECVTRRKEEIAYEAFNKQNLELKKERINLGKTFKSNECVICLTNPSNVLFCNCGHIGICVECDETKGLNVCPVCKTENYTKQMVE